MKLEDIELTDEQINLLRDLRNSYGIGCSCHINPPCSSCTSNITADKVRFLGIDFEE